MVENYANALYWGCYSPLFTGIQKSGVPKFTPYSVDTGEHASSDYR